MISYKIQVTSHSLGFRAKTEKEKAKTDLEVEMVKLFFDSFSSRISNAEHRLGDFFIELQKLRAGSETSRISDIVLLERLQKVEEIVEESLRWVKRVAELASSNISQRSTVQAEGVSSTRDDAARIPGPVGIVVTAEGGNAPLSSVTTTTELHVLSLLDGRGPMSAPEVGKVIGRSREHSARLMKKLYDDGYVKRDQTRIPFRYELVDRVKQSFKTKQSSQEPRGQEPVPQN